MEVVAGVLWSVIAKLGSLLVGEYNLQREVKGGIRFLQSELASIHGALEKVSSTPADQLDGQDKVWARDVRELSYDIEDKVDAFTLRCRGGSRTTKHRYHYHNHHGFKKVLDRSLDLLTRPNIRRKVATDVRDLKTRVREVSERRGRYRINTANDAPEPTIKLDPRLFARYEKAAELVGVDGAKDEVVKALEEEEEDGEVSEKKKKRDKMVSIVGSGGLGKTTLAGVVYGKIRSEFCCSAFVSVSQTPDLERLFKDMFYQLEERSSSRSNVIEELREFLENKRYLIVIDDIWDVGVWKMIKCALPDNNAGCKIITTTRILSVGEHAGDVYKLKPLSPQNARKLFFRRIFGSRKNILQDEEGMENCPYEDIAIVSDKILKKCAGVPLAINTIASRLVSKGRNKMEWYEVCNSIGTGLENSLGAESMRKILSYSYYDLAPQHRTCLLYLIVFSEDFEIEKDRLIWLWIAEGFIGCEGPGKSLFILGESYFDELVNRSMIQHVYHEGFREYCRVHDMVLDLIRSISDEENFVTVLANSTDHAHGSTTVRRLSIQKDKVHRDHAQDITSSMAKVRSVVFFPNSSDQMPALQSFRVLRVLDLEGCEFSEAYSFKYLGNLFHLRYLSLKGTNVEQLPEEVGNLQFLESLATGSSISRLPSSVGQLKRLLRLHVTFNTIVPRGVLGNLRSLEDLSVLSFHLGAESDIVNELGLLTELRVLHLFGIYDTWKMAECLRNLRKIQDLRIMFGKQENTDVLDGWAAPRELRSLVIESSFWSSRLPAWMTASRVPDLRRLHVAVKEVWQEELEVLGRLPALRDLHLMVDHESLGVISGRRFVHGDGSFPRLERCWLRGFAGPPMVFQRGAMPRLGDLGFDFYVREAREGDGGGFDLGLGSLPSLRKVSVWFHSDGAAGEEEVAKAKDALRKEAEMHPNRPALLVKKPLSFCTAQQACCLAHKKMEVH